MNRTQRREAQRLRRSRRRHGAHHDGQAPALAEALRAGLGLNPDGEAMCHGCGLVMAEVDTNDFMAPMGDEERDAFLGFLADVDPQASYWRCRLCDSGRAVFDHPMGPVLVNTGGGCSVPGCHG